MSTNRWEELAGFPVILEIPVLWGDMDPLGHVNNTRFFRWFESARVAYLDRAIIEMGCLPPAVGPILAAIDCNYRRQVIYPDTIDVGADHAVGEFQYDHAASPGQPRAW